MACVDCGGDVLDLQRGVVLERSSVLQDAEASEAAVDETEADVVVQPFETENPWLRRLFGMTEFGNVPGRAIALLGEVSPDPEERLLGAVRTQHGRYKRGYLLLTTQWLRWIQTIPTRTDEYWSYDYSLEISGGPVVGGVLRTPDGNQFQVRWAKAKDFAEVYRIVQQALIWDSDHAVVPSPAPPSAAGGAHDDLVGQLERLAALKRDGVLSEEEFIAAKRRLLG